MKGLAILLIITIIFYIFNGISNNTINFNGGYQPQTEIKQDYQSQTVSQPKQEYQYHMNTQSTYSSKETEVDPKDPLSLSMKRPYKYSDSELRKFLSLSELEWCSKVEQKDAVKRFVWILKSNNKEVYSCEYSYILQRKPKERSVIACQIEEGYQDYINGDKQLYREYIMPTVNDQVEFRPNAGNAYFESYYFLGKFSDMTSYMSGDDIYCTYYWYQNTDRGPMLLYTSKTKNLSTIEGYRYNSWIWRELEKTSENVDIIPFEQYPQSYVHVERFEKWYEKERERQRQKELEELKDLYCVFDDAEDLFYEYPDDFEYFEDAEDFYDDHCQ